MRLVPVFLKTALALCVPEQKKICVFQAFQLQPSSFQLGLINFQLCYLYFFCAIICSNMFKKWVLELILRYE